MNPFAGLFNVSLSTSYLEYIDTFTYYSTCQEGFDLVDQYLRFMQLVYLKLNEDLIINYVIENNVFLFKGESLTYLFNKEVFPRVQHLVHFFSSFLSSFIELSKGPKKVCF